MESGNFFGVDISQIRNTSGVATVYGSEITRHDGFEVIGLNDLARRLNGLPGVARLALGHAMRAEMEGVIELAQDEYVPVDSGETRDSGKVRGPLFPTSDAIEVWGSFGPVKNERGSLYTVPLHEIPEPPSVSVGGRSAHHEWGTWKYLQIPFLVRQEGMLSRIEDEFGVLLERVMK